MDNNNSTLPRVVNSNQNTTSGIVSWIAIIFSLVAMLVGSYNWHHGRKTLQAIVALQAQLSAINDQSNRTSKTQAQFNPQPIINQLQQAQKQGISQQNATISLLSNRIEKIQQTLNETNQKLQTTKQGVKTTNISELNAQNNARWTLGETTYLLKLANLNLSVGNNLSESIQLLEQASARLSKLNMASTTSLQNALNQDIEKLKAVPHLDITSLIKNIDGVSALVKTLPINPSANLSLKNKQTTPDNQKTTEKPKMDLKNWHSIKASVSGLKNLFVIRRLDQPITPLPSPSELVYVKENIRLKLSQAQWAVLHQNQLLYQLNLTAATNLLKQYFEMDADITQKITTDIEKLQSVSIKPDLPKMATSISTIGQALIQINQQTLQAIHNTPTITPSFPNNTPDNQNANTSNSSIKNNQPSKQENNAAPQNNPESSVPNTQQSNPNKKQPHNEINNMQRSPTENILNKQETNQQKPYNTNPSIPI